MLIRCRVHHARGDRGPRSCPHFNSSGFSPAWAGILILGSAIPPALYLCVFLRFRGGRRQANNRLCWIQSKKKIPPPCVWYCTRLTFYCGFIKAQQSAASVQTFSLIGTRSLNVTQSHRKTQKREAGGGVALRLAAGRRHQRLRSREHVRPQRWS